MSLKTVIFTSLTAVLLSLNFAAADSRLSIDTEKSSLSWKGTKVSGSHTGTLAIKDGHVVLKDGKPAGGAFTFDMNSINNTDLESPEYKTKLENHLKSDDFFNVSSFGTATYTIDSITPDAEVDTYKISGTLTVKGISKPLTFKSKITERDSAYHADASLKFDRTLWDIKYNSGKFFDIANLGDKLIYDDIEVSFSLVAPKS